MMEFGHWSFTFQAGSVVKYYVVLYCSNCGTQQLRAGMLCSISSAVTSGTLLKGRIFFPRRSVTETDIDIMRTRCEDGWWHVHAFAEMRDALRVSFHFWSWCASVCCSDCGVQDLKALKSHFLSVGNIGTMPSMAFFTTLRWLWFLAMTRSAVRALP